MTESAPALRLRRDQKIKQGRDFLAARTHGQRVVSGCLVLNWLESRPGASSRVGLITTRKLGGAVVRSRARRLMREAFRLNQHRLTRPVDAILIARNSIVEKPRAVVEADLCAALKRARLLKEE